MHPLAASTFDLPRILKIVDNDRDLLVTLIGLYRDDAAKLLATIDASLTGKEADRLVRAAHTLKGATTVFAADEAVARALEMEVAARERDWDRAVRAHEPLRTVVLRVIDELARLAEPARTSP